MQEFFFSITELGRKANMNHGSVDRQVEKLLARGLLLEKRYGHVRMIEAAFDRFTIQFKKALGVKLIVA